MVSRDEYTYKIDLHVHTQRYSPCAELLDPAHLIAKIHDVQLHGVVITEHDVLWSKDEIALLNNGLIAVKIFRGVEISSSDGHYVVIGLDSLDSMGHNTPIGMILKKAKEQDAVVILAHHHQHYSETPVDTKSLPEGIDAIEVYSSSTFGKNEIEAKHLADYKGWIKVAGSDAHAIEHVGDTYTAFKEMPSDEKMLAHAIRKGDCIPCRLTDHKRKC